MPSRNDYGEVTSASNCLDYQARRLGVRLRDKGAGKDAASQYAHTLNATAAATPRLILALLENGQEADGRVRIPPALQQWLGGRTHIGGKSSRQLRDGTE